MSFLSLIVFLSTNPPVGSFGSSGPETNPDEVVCKAMQPSGTRLGRTEMCLARKDWVVVEDATARGDMVASIGTPSEQPRSEPALTLAERPSAIGYSTIAAALQDLRSRPDVAFTIQNGWTVATDPTAAVTWHFAPPAAAGHPAVIRRQVVADENRSRTETNVRCEAARATCQDIVRAFAQQNGINIAAQSSTPSQK